jgi:hypothetical protein
MPEISNIDNFKQIYDILWLISEVDRLKSNQKEFEFPHISSPFKNVSQLHGELCHHVAKELRGKVAILKGEMANIYPEEKHYPCLLDNLPDVVFDRILSFCTGRELMALSRSFPQLVEKIIRPIVWAKFTKFHFDPVL